MKIVRQLGVFFPFAAAAMLFLYSVLSVRFEVSWIGLLEQGSRLFNHRTLSLTETITWSSAGAPEVISAPLAAIISYLASELGRVFIGIEPLQAQAALMALVFSLGIVVYVRMLNTESQNNSFVVLGALIYSALSLSALQLDTLFFLIMLLPAAYGAIKRNSVLMVLAIVGASRFLGIDGEQMLFLVTFMLVAQLDQTDPRRLKSQCLIILVGGTELWLLSSLLSINPFPYFTNLCLHSTTLYSATRGFSSVDFHSNGLLALALASTFPIAVGLHSEKAKVLARTLCFAAVSLLLCERNLPLFALIYSVSVVELIRCYLAKRPIDTVRLQAAYELGALLLVSLCVSLSLLVGMREADLKSRRAIQSLAPKQITQSVETERVFNDWRLGDYLQSQGISPFVDTRLENISQENQRVYLSLMRAELTSIPQLDRLGVSSVVTTDTSPLCYLLKSMGQWSVKVFTLSSDPKEPLWVRCDRNAT